MDKKVVRDIVEWDAHNWGKAIEFIDSKLKIEGEKRVLEIGARNGGMSLYFALKGHACVCTDLKNPEDIAKKKHSKYGVEIKYDEVDATCMPSEYENSFDIVTWKSVLGGIGSYGNIQREKAVISEIYRVLKPGGFVVFVENLIGMPINMFMRKHFTSRGDRWHYYSSDEMMNLFCEFSVLHWASFGVVANLGFNETTRRILGRVDDILELVAAETSKYIGVFIMKKSE